jgi:uncharacterized membrane protein
MWNPELKISTMRDNMKNNSEVASSSEMEVVVRNINALLNRSQEEEKRKTRGERIADAITGFTGSMTFVYIHLIIFGIWIIWNLGWLGLKPFDPSFVVLAMIASVEAIFLSTFVLISQNRMNAQADKRAELNLQVNLLAEHEITRLIQLVTAMAKKMDIPESYDAEIDILAKDVQPEKVLETMEKHTKEAELRKNSGK